MGYFQQFGVFPETFDIFGCDLFAISDSDLSIVDRIFTRFVIKKFHYVTAKSDISHHNYTTYTT